MATQRETDDALFQSAGQVPAVSFIDAVVFYDPEDGTIRHMHHAVTFSGAERRPREHQEESGAEAARKLGCKLDDLKVLHLPDFRPSGKTYRVDIARETLIEEIPNYTTARRRR